MTLFAGLRLRLSEARATLQTMNPTIQKIEADAARKGVTMTDACRKAGVNYSTWWRWRHSKTEPRSSKLEAVRKAINPTRK